MRQWRELKPQANKPFYKPKSNEVKKIGFWMLEKRFNSIAELNDYLYQLRQQGKQVETITTQIKTTKPFKTIRYLLWKNQVSGVYLAETRIEKPNMRLTDIQGSQQKIDTNILTRS